jgi:hypothetical protein
MLNVVILLKGRGEKEGGGGCWKPKSKSEFNITKTNN